MRKWRTEEWEVILNSERYSHKQEAVKKVSHTRLRYRTPLRLKEVVYVFYSLLK